jgi:hypothetical protein
MHKLSDCFSVETLSLQPRPPYELTGQQAIEHLRAITLLRTKLQDRSQGSVTASQDEEKRSGRA